MMDRPLAHLFVDPVPNAPELASVSLSREIDRFDRNAQSRKQMATTGFWTLLMLFGGVSIISFTALYGLAAVVDQGASNFKAWVASHEPV